jgi:hypothetical protein
MLCDSGQHLRSGEGRQVPIRWCNKRLVKTFADDSGCDVVPMGQHGPNRQLSAKPLEPV